jgi:hypothetical protein
MKNTPQQQVKALEGQLKLSMLEVERIRLQLKKARVQVEIEDGSQPVEVAPKNGKSRSPKAENSQEKTVSEGQSA